MSPDCGFFLIRVSEFENKNCCGLCFLGLSSRGIIEIAVNPAAAKSRLLAENISIYIPPASGAMAVASMSVILSHAIDWPDFF